MTSDLARKVRHERVAADPRALCSALGLLAPGTFRKQATGLLVRCVAHDDRTPSLSVRVAKDQTIACRCHGCGWTADAIGLVAKVRGLDFREAVAELARLAGDYTAVAELETPRAPTAETAPTIDPATYHAVAVALLEACPLDASADVADYLRARGILDEARGAGLAALPPPAAQPALLRKLVASFGAPVLERAGLVQRGAFAWAAHRLIIPWRDRFGRVGALQRRVLEPRVEPKYIFPRGLLPRAPFGAEAMREGDMCFAEGALDALAMRALDRMQGRVRVVLAIPSATTWRAEWSELVRGRDVFIAFDADVAGDAAADRFAREVCSGARRVFRERPERAKDVGEVLARRLAR